METRLSVLKLFLDALGVDDHIATVDDRKKIQKAVYLGQVISGVDLGYRFGWYLMGPYSPDLTKDYYSLAEAIAGDDRGYQNMELIGPVAQKLTPVKRLLEKPGDWTGSHEDWLELIASYHYLRKISRFDHERAKDQFRKQKPRLEKHVDFAQSVLTEAGLLS